MAPGPETGRRHTGTRAAPSTRCVARQNGGSDPPGASGDQGGCSAWRIPGATRARGARFRRWVKPMLPKPGNESPVYLDNGLIRRPGPTYTVQRWLTPSSGTSMARPSKTPSGSGDGRARRGITGQLHGIFDLSPEAQAGLSRLRQIGANSRPCSGLGSLLSGLWRRERVPGCRVPVLDTPVPGL